MKFPLENISTEQLMGKPILDIDLGDTGKGRFADFKRIEITSLHPRQTHVSGGTLNYKMAGNGFTVPYVVISDQGNILIDGHHTVIVKKLKGQKYIYAYCYTLKNN